jgi:DNA-binding SARP family transcriptional activator
MLSEDGRKTVRGAPGYPHASADPCNVTSTQNCVRPPDRLEVRLFGHGRITQGGSSHGFRAPKKALALLAYLILFPGQNWRRDVAFALWPDVTEDDALANLRRHLALLSATLPASTRCVSKTRSHVEWLRSPAIWVDVTAYESAAEHQPELAVELYTSDLLETLDEDWLAVHRHRLRDRQLVMLAALTNSHREGGDLQRAISYSQRRLRMDPWSETTLRELLDLRLEHGDRAGAVEDYRQFATRLKADLGIDPSSETIDAYRAISSGAHIGQLPPPAIASPRAFSPSLQPPPSQFGSVAALFSFAGPVDEHVFRAVTQLPAGELDVLAAGGWLDSTVNADDTVLYAPGDRLRRVVERNPRLQRLIARARAVHAAHYERIAGEFYRRYWDDVHSPLHRAIDQQLPELCAALRYVLGLRETARAAQFMEYLRPFFLDSGRLVVADELYDELLGQRGLLPREWQITCWDAKSVIAHRRGLHAQAVANLEASLPLVNHESEPVSISGAVSLMYLGRTQESLRYLQSTLAAERRKGVSMGLCWTIWAIAEVLLATESDIEWARALLDESNDIAARQAYPMLLAISQYQRARCAMVQGDLESAMVAIDSALQGFTNLHARGKTFSCYALFVRAQLAFIQGRMASARAHLASALEFLLVLGDSTWIARVIELCAESVLGDGDFFAAAEFLGSSFSVAPVFLTYPLDDNRRRERLTASLRSYLGSIDFATAIGIGSRRSIHDVRRLMPREFSGRRLDSGKATG